MQQNEFHDKRVYKYDFTDLEINKILDQLSDEMKKENEQYEKSVKQTKILVAVAATLLVTLLEYLVFRDGWGVTVILTMVMAITPFIGGFVAYMSTKLYMLIKGEEMHKFHRAYHWAKEDQRFYIYEGYIQDILKKEKYWSYIVAGNYLWRVRNGKFAIESSDQKAVKLLLVDSYSDDMTYECIYVL